MLERRADAAFPQYFCIAATPTAAAAATQLPLLLIEKRLI